MLAPDTRVQAPVLDSYSDLPLFNTKAVVHHTGVPAPTLRAWERRYGILAPRRGENDYRLYSERDMATIAWLRERVESGMTISQAIALLRSLESGRKVRRRVRPGQPGHGEPPADATAVRAQTQSGATVATSFALDELRQRLLGQFLALDEAGATSTIAQSLAVHGVEDVCLGLFVPVLADIGHQWAEGMLSVTVEHFSSALIRAQLDALYRSAPAMDGGPLVMIGCAPGEMHELGALMLALFARRAGLRVAYLGQNLEVESLIATLIAADAACVVLSASLRPHAEALIGIGQRLHELELGRESPAFYYGGQAFGAFPELAERIAGHYLGGNAQQAAGEIKRRLSA